MGHKAQIIYCKLLIGYQIRLIIDGLLGYLIHALSHCILKYAFQKKPQYAHLFTTWQ